MAKASNNSNKRKPTAAVKDVVDLFDSSWTYAKDNHHDRWKRNYKLYNNQRWMESYKGITNTFVPMPFSMVETITAALAAGRPSIDFVPQDMFQYIMTTYQNGGKEPNLKALNAQFDYFWDCDNWDVKSIKTIRNGFIFGTSCEYVYWDVDKPRIINLPVRDAIIDPKLTDPMQLITDPKDFYTGRRYMTTKEALEAEVILDPDTKKVKNRFSNLSGVIPGKGNGDQTDKELKEMFIGSIGDSSKLVEVIEINDGETIRSVANRTTEIENRPNDLGMHNLVIHRFIADESIIYGKAIIDPIAQAVELLNDMTNQSVDAVTDILNPQYELDPVYSDYLEDLTNAPGTVHPFKPGSLAPVTKPIVPSAAFNERLNIKNEINEATGVDQIVKGTVSDQTNTATEIKAQLNQAGQRFDLYIRMLEREGFYQRAKIVYKMMLHHIKEKQLVPVSSVGGPKFMQYDPSHFDETYEPKIQLEANIQNQKQKTQQQTTQAYEVIIADPTNDLWEAKKILYPKMFDLSEEELDKIIGSQKPMQPSMPTGAPGEAAGPMPGAGPAPEMAPQGVAA